MLIKFRLIFIQGFSVFTQFLPQDICQEICNFLFDWFNFKQSFKKKKMFSTFQATVKVAKNTKRETMYNLEKWIIKMV